MNDTIRIFGVRQVGFFVEKLKISNDGITYKNRQYGWAAVVTVKRSDDIINVLSRHPSSTILLEDGKIIRLPVSLEEKSKLASESSYENCLDIIESKIHNNNRMFEKYLCPYSYIIFYRLAILVGLIQMSLLIGLDLFSGKSIDSDMKWLSIPLQFTLLGIYMTVRRHIDETKIQTMLKGNL